MRSEKLQIGYVPEHFATPLHFAFSKFGLDEHATLRPFPSGTGTMIEAFREKEIDVGIGLTEAWVVGISKTEPSRPLPYHIVGSYVESPLLWAISTGGKRSDINSVEDLQGKKAGISRNGSGSHIMASVLAQENGWSTGSDPLEFVVCGPFAPLREAVNNETADFFMWEHFTSKKYFDDGTLKRVGEIETPWNGWHIAALGSEADERIARYLLPALKEGIQLFEVFDEMAVQYIVNSKEHSYSTEDAQAWYKGVKFASREQMGNVNPATMEKTIGILKVAGVLGARSLRSAADVQADGAEIYKI